MEDTYLGCDLLSETIEGHVMSEAMQVQAESNRNDQPLLARSRPTACERRLKSRRRVRRQTKRTHISFSTTKTSAE